MLTRILRDRKQQILDVETKSLSDEIDDLLCELDWLEGEHWQEFFALLIQIEERGYSSHFLGGISPILCESLFSQEGLRAFGAIIRYKDRLCFAQDDFGSHLVINYGMEEIESVTPECLVEFAQWCLDEIYPEEQQSEEESKAAIDQALKQLIQHYPKAKTLGMEMLEERLGRLFMCGFLTAIRDDDGLTIVWNISGRIVDLTELDEEEFNTYISI